MRGAQASDNEEYLIGTTVGINLVHIGLAWSVAGIVAIYGGFWIVLTIPALGVGLWLVSLPITKIIQSHGEKAAAKVGFAGHREHEMRSAA
ncbi:hypothetical protein [Rhodococcus sp. NPDC058521]|uniref:hypothetical protein n=1 Tax=Rhodococcus sp. NPDC058521 TaxID=3346536 RepID=UPI00365BC6A4